MPRLLVGAWLQGRSDYSGTTSRNAASFHDRLDAEAT